MEGKDLKLHLGCGTVYLPGYINIDYPLDIQSSQHAQQVPVDLYADITTLHYMPGSVAEVRLHHVFEHFDRATALRLLVEWYEWLMDGGILTIETPDFDRCIKAYLLGNTRTKARVLRHVFGSHDSHWAVHYDGWYKAKFKGYLSAIGFRKLNFDFTEWQGTYNITVRAQKIDPFTTLPERKKAAEDLLRLSLVDDSSTEQQVLSTWMKSFDTRPDGIK